jgi:hypothetical protein
VSDSLTIDVDDHALLAAFDALPEAVMSYAKPAALVTAKNIAAEAGRRVARRTGKTAEGITVEETHAGDGYIVWVKRPELPNLPTWLEFGTEHMTARPFLFASAQLEVGAHDRRVREAVQDALDAQGLGD